MMIESQYPPLPEPAYTRVGIDVMAGNTPSRMQQVPIQISGVQAFSAEQMHAYIDADRAQRKPLTDKECWQLICAANSVGHFDDEEQSAHVPDDVRLSAPYRFFQKQADAMRAVLNPPPRSDAGNN